MLSKLCGCSGGSPRCSSPQHKMHHEGTQDWETTESVSALRAPAGIKPSRALKQSSNQETEWDGPVDKLLNPQGPQRNQKFLAPPQTDFSLRGDWCLSATPSLHEVLLLMFLSVLVAHVGNVHGLIWAENYHIWEHESVCSAGGNGWGHGMQRSCGIFKRPGLQSKFWSSGRCVRRILFDACLIPLHLLLVSVRDRIDCLVLVTCYDFLSSVAFW